MEQTSISTMTGGPRPIGLRCIIIIYRPIRYRDVGVYTMYNTPRHSRDVYAVSGCSERTVFPSIKHYSRKHTPVIVAIARNRQHA